MVLPGHRIAEFVTNYVLKDKQLQPAGVDLTVGKVFKFKSALTLGFDYRELPEVEEIAPRDGRWFLPQGAYKVMFNEVVKVPDSYVGLCFPRSTLLRSGTSLLCTVWDPGYYGRGEGLLTVFNPHGLILSQNARVAQIVFIELREKPVFTYRGTYLGENIG